VTSTNGGINGKANGVPVDDEMTNGHAKPEQQPAAEEEDDKKDDAMDMSDS